MLVLAGVCLHIFARVTVQIHSQFSFAPWTNLDPVLDCLKYYWSTCVTIITANILLIYFAVLSCPNIQSKSHSDCKMFCLADEHCENHGDDLKCCPTVPGSNCKAECKEPVLSPNGGSKLNFTSDLQGRSGWNWLHSQDFSLTVRRISVLVLYWISNQLLSGFMCCKKMFTFFFLSLFPFPEICYDFENDRKYTVGDIFPRDGVCCRCELGGIMNCSAVKSCTQGNNAM